MQVTLRISMHDDLERMWKLTVVASFKLMSQNSNEWSQRNHEEYYDDWYQAEIRNGVFPSTNVVC
jgi:hypothetical protein